MKPTVSPRVYEAYRENPEVARRRMYLETLQNVLGRSDKVILDSGAGGAVPYLPLNELRNTQRGQTKLSPGRETWIDVGCLSSVSR